MAAATTFPIGTRCATCGHLVVFHPGTGPCRSNQCRANCHAFVPAGEQPHTVRRPDLHQLADALDVLTATIEYAPPAGRAEAATHLLAALAQLPLTRKTQGHRAVIRRLKACRDHPDPRQDAEVANDNDAQDGPGST